MQLGHQKRNTARCSFRRNLLVEHTPCNKIGKAKQDRATFRISYCHLEEGTEGEIVEANTQLKWQKRTLKTFSAPCLGQNWLIALSIRKRFTIEYSEAKHCLNLRVEAEKTPQSYITTLSWDCTWLWEVSRALWQDMKLGYSFYCWFALYITWYNSDSVEKLS